MEKTNIEQKISLPKGVKVTIQDQKIIVEGPKGTVERKITEKGLNHKTESDSLTLQTNKMNKKEKKIIFTYAAHIQNMIKGVTQGHTYEMKICSGHFPMNVTVSGDELIIKNFIGEKKPRKLKIRKGVNIKVDGEKIIIENINKELASQTAADIEQLTRRVGFDRRKFQDGIYITNKDGKPVA